MELKITKDEKDLLIGILEHALDEADMETTLEFGSDVRGLIGKLEKFN